MLKIVEQSFLIHQAFEESQVTILVLRGQAADRVHLAIRDLKAISDSSPAFPKYLSIAMMMMIRIRTCVLSYEFLSGRGRFPGTQRITIIRRSFSRLQFDGSYSLVISHR